MKVADQLARHIDAAVVAVIQKSFQTTEEMARTAPELARHAKRMLYDYTRKLGLNSSELEYAGIPTGYFRDFQPSQGDNFYAMSKADEGEGTSSRPTKDIGQTENLNVSEKFPQLGTEPTHGYKQFIQDCFPRVYDLLGD